ncbi:MAG: hypothetical protein AB7H90_23900 [Alphaproteobacteria bacterium]
MPPGHHIGEHQAPFPRQRKSRVEPRKIRGLGDHGLVGQHVQASLESGDDALDLTAVATREDGNATWCSVRYAVKKIGTGMHVEPPIGGPLRPLVVPSDPAQVIDQVRAWRCVHAHEQRPYLRLLRLGPLTSGAYTRTSGDNPGYISCCASVAWK